MAEITFPNGGWDATEVEVTAGGVLIPKSRQGIHITDPFVEAARLRLAVVDGVYRLPTSDAVLAQASSIRCDGTTAVGVDDGGITGAFGERLMGAKREDVSVSFQYDYLNTFDDVVITTSGDGATSAANSLAVAETTTTGTSVIESRRLIRYRTGHVGYANFTAQFTGSSGTGWVGPHDDDDGFALKYNAAADTMQFGYIQAGTFVGEDLQYIDIAETDINWGAVNVFYVLFGYLGTANTVLMIKKNGAWRCLHMTDTEGVLVDTTHVRNPYFPVRVKAEDGCTVKTGSWDGGTIGGDDDIPGRAFHFPNIPMANGTGPGQGQASLGAVAGNVITCGIWHNKTTYKGKTNKVPARLLNYEMFVDPPSGNVSGRVSWMLLANPTLSGTPTYTDIDADTSIIEYDHDDTGGTGSSVSYSSGGRVALCGELYYSGGTTGRPGTSGKSGIIDAIRLGAEAYPDDTFVLVAKDLAGNSVDFRWYFNWEELF